jgi:hypothetical protein
VQYISHKLTCRVEITFQHLAITQIIEGKNNGTSKIT